MSQDTPMTDAIGIDHLTATEREYKYRKLGRQIERELTAAQAENAELRAKCERLQKKRAYWKRAAKAASDKGAT